MIIDVIKNPNKLLDALDEYDKFIEDAKVIFELDGKNLVQMCRDHSKHLYFYKKKLNELESIEKHFKLEADRISSNHWKKYNENHSRSLSSTDIKQYISGEEDYIEQWELIIEIVNIKKQYQAIVEALEDMSWMLGHITKLKIAEMEDLLL